MALVAGEEFEGEAIRLAEKALKADPKLYEADELIARVQLEDGSAPKAAEAARKALEIYPEALDAMALLGTIDLLDDKTNSPWMAKALAINPGYGNVYAVAAHFFIITRRYDEGIALYRKALALDPSLNGARCDMGVNLMRLGQDAEARKQLEQVYNAGYQNPETVEFPASARQHEGLHPVQHGSDGDHSRHRAGAAQERGRAAAPVFPGGIRAGASDLRKKISIII